MANVEYNFKYIKDLCDNSRDKNSYEMSKLIESIDDKVTDRECKRLFHIVPILYSVTIVCGSCVFLYKILYGL